jgi:hypothetical protein
MQIVKGWTGMRGFDTVELPAFSVALLKQFRDAGYDFAMGYLGSVTPQTVQNVFAAGLLFSPICYPPQTTGWIPTVAAGAAMGLSNVGHMRALSMPVKASPWIDLEGCGGVGTQARDWVNAFGMQFDQAQFGHGLYVGIQSMDADMLFHGLPNTHRYWRSCSKACVEPKTRGFGLLQLRPDDIVVLGHQVDIDVVERDGLGSYPEFVGP